MSKPCNVHNLHSVQGQRAQLFNIGLIGISGHAKDFDLLDLIMRYIVLSYRFIFTIE